MDPALIGFFGVAIAGAIAVAYAVTPSVLEAWRVRRRVRRATRVAIRDLAEGTVGRIAGRVDDYDHRTLIAPLTGRRCVYYAVSVDVRHKNWQHLFRERRGVTFALRDHTGMAIVDPHNAEVALDFDHEERCGWTRKITHVQDELVTRNGHRSMGVLGPRTLRFRETVIEVGAQIDLCGTGVREPDPALHTISGYRDPMPTRIYITTSAEAPLSITSRAEPGEDA